MYSRVSSSAMYKSILGTLNNNLANYQNLVRQQSTLQKYATLSENPSAVSRALEIESEMTANEQYQANNQVAVSMLKYSETAMNTILNAAQSIRDLVIEAGDGALSPDELEDIALQIEANRDKIIDALNTKVAGQYIFGGTNTTEKPFTVNADGTITYNGTDTGLQYALSETLNGVVSFTGSEVLSKSEDTFFICSHEVPDDWTWTGREEKVQITVGNRTIAVYIPENWVDEVVTAKPKATDYNRYRDPGEVSGISLDDLATLINRSLEEQGADMLVKATVQKNGGTQQLFIKSLTGEEIGITSWTDTDYLPMAQSVAGIQLEKTGSTAGKNLQVKRPDWNGTVLTGMQEADLSNLTGKSITIKTTDSTGAQNTINYTFTAAPASITDLVNTLNGGVLPTGVTAVAKGNTLTLGSNDTIKAIQVNGDAAPSLFGAASNTALQNTAPKVNGLMGTVNLLNWRDDNSGKGITIEVNGTGNSFDVDFAGLKNITELIEKINSEAKAKSIDCTASVASGRLVLQSSAGPIKVSDPGSTGSTAQLFGVDTGADVKSSTSSLTITVNNDTENATVIFINADDDLEQIASKINAIEGVYARHSADKDQLVVVAQRIGDTVGDHLSVDAAKEATHYPPISVIGSGAALQLFDFDITTDATTGEQIGTVASEFVTRAVDHSHMDVFAVLGMETALKSCEMGINETVEVTGGTSLHWRVSSGGKTAEIVLDKGKYTLTDIADRLNSAAGGWLDVVVDVSNPKGVNSDQTEYDDFKTSYNSEVATQRLVIRGLNGQEVILVDMNEQHYADKLGLSTALRADTNTGVKNITFPDAACVDDNIGVQMRVQMNCGMTYDINIKKSDVVDPASGLVNRAKVMEQIVKQVNAQEGKTIMGITYPTNEAKPAAGDDQKISEMASIYFLSGEPFTVVDLPFDDPYWSSFSGGIAAQLGIHGGVTANLAKVGSGMTDINKFSAANTGTIKFESLGHSVEIDVVEGDTIKNVMDRVRAAAGDWLYVNYFDAHIGSETSLGRSGDYPIIAFSAKDGSAVSITDMSGSVAQDILGISTGVQGTVNVSPDSKVNSDADKFVWKDGSIADFFDNNWGSKNPNPTSDTCPAGMVFEINVAGYTHTIDMTAMLDTNHNEYMDCEDLVATINARMQDYDIKAELNKEGKLVLSSLRGYSFSAEIYFVDHTGARDNVKDGNNAEINLNKFFLGTAKSVMFDKDGNVTADASKKVSETVTTYYRGGYQLDKDASTRSASSIYTQNATIRSGSNTATQTAYEMLNDVTAAVRSGNRDALGEKMLPRIDEFINNILTIMSTNGALQNRYMENYNRLATNDIILSEEQDDLVGIDLAEIATAIAEANYAYQANLYSLSTLMSMPTLLDFMR